MKMKQMMFVPTLNEFVNMHHNNPDPKIKILVDDFCEFPESEPKPNQSQTELFKARNILRSNFQNRADDIIMFNRYAIAQYNRNAEEIAPKFEQFDQEFNGMFTSLLEKQDENEISDARLGFKNFDWYCEVLNARSIANEGLIIHLWASIEQYVKRAILAMNNKTRDVPYQWDKIKEKSKLNGLDLSKLPSYDLIDELRVVNNKIKHIYIVDDQLCHYKGFTKHKGKPMNYVDYRVHEYAIGAHHFINRLISAMGPTIRYTHDIAITDES
ncbi:TPA: hypothetical protein PXM49_003712 [Yersinia enterocolitica]|nr:hypothetical protein [Yersinia enterocolitica]